MHRSIRDVSAAGKSSSNSENPPRQTQPFWIEPFICVMSLCRAPTLVSLSSPWLPCQSWPNLGQKVRSNPYIRSTTRRLAVRSPRNCNWHRARAASTILCSSRSLNLHSAYCYDVIVHDPAIHSTRRLRSTVGTFWFGTKRSMVGKHTNFPYVQTAQLTEHKSPRLTPAEYQVEDQQPFVYTPQKQKFSARNKTAPIPTKL